MDISLDLPISPSFPERLPWYAEADGHHFGEVCDTVANVQHSNKPMKIVGNSRGLHGLAPLLHSRRPSSLDMFSLGDDIGRVQCRKLSLIGRSFAHLPEEPAFRIGLVRRDIQRPLRGLKSLDDPKARFINSALGFLCVFERDADLVAELRPLVFLELGFWLGKVVLEKIEETRVVVFGDP